jgi:hypothetical protein
MNCKQAQLLMALFIANDPDLTGQQYTDFQEHLKRCPECAREYEESKFAIELAKQYWPISNETATAIEKASRNYEPKMTVEEGWKNLCGRCPELAENTKKPKSLRLFVRIGAVAACLVMGVLTWMILSTHSTLKITPEITSQQPVIKPKPFVKIELISEDGSSLLADSQQIDSANKLKTLVINGKHRLVMNTKTSLSIEPLTVNAQLGCLVKLADGEIYTHVQCDGNPFVVATNSGKAVITGTVFNIKTDNKQMELIVTEGSVRFENENGSVNVKTGQKSILTANSKPTLPALCNVEMLTAWATISKVKKDLLNDEAPKDYNITDLWLTAVSGPANLDSIEYNSWTKENYDWFKREFPWIFQLERALAIKGVEVNYPELLVKTGDIWQFVYPESSSTRIPIINPPLLMKVISFYGFSEQWLSDVIPATKVDLATQLQYADKFTDLEALEKWATVLKKAKSTPTLDDGTLLYSLHASVYIAKTRTLAWLCINNGILPCEMENKTELLGLLDKQVGLAHANFQAAIFLMAEQGGSYDTQHIDQLETIISNIETICISEKSINDKHKHINFSK